MRIAVAQLGARNHYAVPRIFHEAAILERLFTDSYVGNKPWLGHALGATPQGLRPRFVDMWLSRDEPRIPPEKVTSFDILGIAYARARRRSESRTESFRAYREFGLHFQHAILRNGLGAATAIYVMPGTADQIVKYASARGISTVMEQFDHTLGWRSRLIEEEIGRWGTGFPGAFLPDASELEHAREVEATAIGGAEKVIVASDYTRRAMTFDGYETADTRIVPYGIDLSRWTPSASSATRVPGPLRVLYVAAVDLRKGVLYLLEALKRLNTKNIEFRAAGRISLDHGLLSAYVDDACFLGPVPRNRVQELFRWADIFVFPTLGEGFGMVQVEAIATGTPVIATTECGDVIHEGKEGHIVEPRDPDAIASWLDHYATDPARLEPLRAAALKRSWFFSLDAYAERLLAAVSEQHH